MNQALDFGAVGIAHINQFHIPPSEKIVIRICRTGKRKRDKRPPQNRLVAPSLDRIIKSLIVDIPWRDKKCSIERPQIWNAPQISRNGVVDKALYFDRFLQFPIKHFRMNDTVSTHNDEIEISETIDEVSNHAHVIWIPFPIKAIHSGCTGN